MHRAFRPFTVRHYEVVYLIHEDRVEEVENVVSKVQGTSLNTWTSLVYR